VERTRIKICGTMRPEDAALAQRLGADAIGMIFHPPAKRNISIQQARAILAVLGPFVTPVGIFVDATTDTIGRTAGELGLRVVQLHGHESIQQAAELGSLKLTLIKALRVDETFEREAPAWREFGRGEDCLAAIVLESNSAGGSGVATDWQAVRQHQLAGHMEGLRIVAAGGLTPQTVGDVVRTIHPWAVDVSSGVENAPGTKSPEKVLQFVQAVRQADAAAET